MGWTELILAVSLVGCVAILVLTIVQQSAQQNRVVQLLLVERKELTDRVMYLTRQDFDWLKHRRQIEEVEFTKQVQETAVHRKQTAAPLDIEKMTPGENEIRLPSHGGFGGA